MLMPSADARSATGLGVATLQPSACNWPGAKERVPSLVGVPEGSLSGTLRHVASGRCEGWASSEPNLGTAGERRSVPRGRYAPPLALEQLDPQPQRNAHRLHARENRRPQGLDGDAVDVGRAAPRSSRTEAGEQRRGLLAPQWSITARVASP
jgi:hypothetical protein